jgi:hypothetical protein
MICPGYDFDASFWRIAKSQKKNLLHLLKDWNVIQLTDLIIKGYRLILKVQGIEKNGFLF